MPDSAPLRDAVAQRMKEAMKAGDKVRVGALRLIMAALKEREIEARGAGKIVSRADELAILTRKRNLPLGKLLLQRPELPRSQVVPKAPRAAVGKKSDVPIL